MLLNITFTLHLSTIHTYTCTCGVLSASAPIGISMSLTHPLLLPSWFHSQRFVANSYQAWLDEQLTDSQQHSIHNVHVHPSHVSHTLTYNHKCINCQCEHFCFPVHTHTPKVYHFSLFNEVHLSISNSLNETSSHDALRTPVYREL